jgi:hypothetical protein
MTGRSLPMIQTYYDHLFISVNKYWIFEDEPSLHFAIILTALYIINFVFSLLSNGNLTVDKIHGGTTEANYSLINKNRKKIADYMVSSHQKERKLLARQVEEIDNIAGGYQRRLRIFLYLMHKIFYRVKPNIQRKQNSYRILDHMTLEAFDRCLLLAFIYPIVLAFAIWSLSNHDLKIMDILVAYSIEPWIGLLGMLVITTLYVAAKISIRKVMVIMIIIYAVISLFISKTGSFQSNSINAIIVVCSIMGVLTRTGIVAIFTCFLTLLVFTNSSVNNLSISSEVFVFLISLLSITFINKNTTKFYEKLKKYTTTKYLYLILGFIIVVTLPLLSFEESLINEDLQNRDDLFHVIFLMLLLLPSINAFFDWISISATRSLIKRSLEDNNCLLNIAYDFGIALLCAIGATTTTIIILKLLDNSGETQKLIDSIIGMNIGNIKHLFKENGWFILCLYTTLFPTIIHISVVAISITGSVPVVSNFRRIAKKIQDGKYRDDIQALSNDRDKIAPYFNLNDPLLYVPCQSLRNRHIFSYICFIGTISWIVYILLVVIPPIFFSWGNSFYYWLDIPSTHKNFISENIG